MDILGGQNPYAQLAAGAEGIDLSNLSPYDQGCNEEFQNAAKNYFEGNATLDEALDMFKKAVKHFDYCDVLSLSSVVDVEYMMFKRDVYYHWYMHNKQSA